MNKSKLVYTTYIRTTPGKLWAAITKPEFTCLYWAGARNKSDWKKGSKWEHVFEDDPDPVAIIGEVLEIDKPRRLVLSWASPDSPKDVSRVTFEIEQLKGVVCLTVTHDGFNARSAMQGKVSSGWPRVLSSMKSYLETGKGLDMFN